MHTINTTQGSVLNYEEKNNIVTCDSAEFKQGKRSNYTVLMWVTELK